jgi:hypothetical protein
LFDSDVEALERIEREAWRDLAAGFRAAYVRPNWAFPA